MKLMCYQLSLQAPKIEPGRPEREWMDGYGDKRPYRCLPLLMANSTGWQLLNQLPFRATWNGGPHPNDIVIEQPFGDQRPGLEHFVLSHFGGGVLTFQTLYLFRTPKDWDLWIGGPPNSVKHGAQALSGIVESYWLPMSFTMNWRFTAPGTISFAEGEPFAFLMPVPHAAIDEFEPVVAKLYENPELRDQFGVWHNSRGAFLEDARNAPQGDAAAAGWQRHYFQGVHPDGRKGADDHIHKRRLKAPREAAKGELE